MEFTFNASAIAAGGIIERGNVTSVIPSLASVALAPTGGDGRTVVSNYVSEELSFSHAETRVFGREVAKDLFTTSTYVLVKDLRVFDKLAIGELRGEATSTRSFADEDDHDFTLTVAYRGVVIAGKEVNPKIDLSIKSLRRYQHLDQILSAGSGRAAKLPDGLVATKDKKALAERFNARTPVDLSERLKDLKAVQGSMIEQVEGRVTTSKHHKIFIPDFGTVRFGELMLKPGRRRVNLLRITFGNKDLLGLENESVKVTSRSLTSGSVNEDPEEEDGFRGSMTIASVEGNGTIVGP
ncbi:MAG: hypothetical protein ABI779_11185 [Acidobacteriota bacterium]